MRLILASGSAARQTMLRHAGVKFFSLPADLDEAEVKNGFAGTPEELALALAAAKAGRVAAHYPESLVIGSDQVLVCEGATYDKPLNLTAAAAQLRHLSGRTHTLVTAVCVHERGAMVWSDIANATLTMRKLSEDFIADYLRAEGKAICASVGAYRLEALGAQLFSAVSGDFFTILGLNLLPLLGFLRDAGELPA